MTEIWPTKPKTFIIIPGPLQKTFTKVGQEQWLVEIAEYTQPRELKKNTWDLSLGLLDFKVPQV